jgi:hypothetical protein
MATDMVTAEFGLFSGRRGGYDTLVVPQWVLNPTVLPRQDSADKLQIRVSRRYMQERWLIVPLSSSSNVLIAFGFWPLADAVIRKR